MTISNNSWQAVTLTELLVRERGLDEDLRERLALLGQIVIAERAGGIGIVEVDELPIRGLGDLGVVQRHRVAPDRKEMLVEAFLQRGGELGEWHAEVDRRLVDAGDPDGPALASLRRVNDVHDTLP